MPKISKKGHQMPSSPIRKLVPFAEAAKRKGRKVIHLNIGQPDIKTPKHALEELKKTNLEVLAYSRTDGSEEYRKKLCEYYRKHQIHIQPHQIAVTTGGSEALLFVIGAIADEGDEIIISEPFYANYNGFSAGNGVKVVPVTSNFEDNFELPPISKFEEKITKKTKAILLCNPGNPTGYLYTQEEIAQIADLALKHDLFVISDEVYREFTYDDKMHHSIMEVEGLEEHAIIIDSVSKRYSMCGARIGCVISKNEELLQTVIKFAQARLSPPTLAQIVAEAALDTPENYFEEVRDEYVRRRNFLMHELSLIEGVAVARPSGAFYCVVKLPVPDAEQFCEWLLADFEVDGETLMLAPAAGFYATEGMGKDQIRIAYVLDIPTLKRAVIILKEGLKKYNP